MGQKSPPTKVLFCHKEQYSCGQERKKEMLTIDSCERNMIHITFICWFVYRQPCVAQTGVEFTVKPRMALNSLFLCLYFPSARNTGVHHHILFMWYLESNPGLQASSATFYRLYYIHSPLLFTCFFNTRLAFSLKMISY